MRTIFCTLALMIAVRALAAEPPKAPPPDKTAPEAPPSPPPVVWEVWSFKWEGQWVKQPTHCLKTTDLKQAIDYAQEVFSFAGWATRKNIPAFCMTLYTYSDPVLPTWAGPPEDVPPHAVFAVWAFKLTDGKWVKNDEYSWESSKWVGGDERLVALDLVKRINAVPGWRATTNAPACDIPENQRYAHGGEARGAGDRGWSINSSWGNRRVIPGGGGRYDYRGLDETNGGWSRRGFRVPSDAERQRIHDSIYEENQRTFQQNMDDFNRSMQNLGNP